MKLIKLLHILPYTLVLGITTSIAQEVQFSLLKIHPEPIREGEFNNYDAYDIGHYILYNGRYENNLKFRIQNKSTGTTDFIYEDSISDAMILVPGFFANEDRSWILIMVEVAAEYSWGQEVLVIRDGKVNYPGFLNYAVAGDELEESLFDHCIVTGSNEKIIISFGNIKIIDYNDPGTEIRGIDLRFEIDEAGIRQIY